MLGAGALGRPRGMVWGGRRVKAIARIEGFSIRDVVEKFLSDGIARYEQKHGAVTNRKKNIDDIL